MRLEDSCLFEKIWQGRWHSCGNDQPFTDESIARLLMGCKWDVCIDSYSL